MNVFELDSQAIEVHAMDASSLNCFTLFRFVAGIFTGFSSLLSNELLNVFYES